MQKSKCTHIRIRDNNDYNLDVEDFLKRIERKFNIDIRSLPQWKEIVQRLYVTQTDCKRQIQYANLQKANIINKLYKEFTRLSPFDLTKQLARTGSLWSRLQNERKGQKQTTTVQILESFEATAETVEEEISEEQDTIHPNTENETEGSVILAEPRPSKSDAEAQFSSEHLTQTNTLPVFISTNTHKLISPLGSKVSPLSCASITDQLPPVEGVEITEWQPSTSAVICNPPHLGIACDSLGTQSILFSITNCTAETLYIRFKYITDNFPFKYTKLLPVIPKRLYPGIAVVYKLLYKLKSQEPFKTCLYFKIGHDVYSGVPSEQFFVPIVSSLSLKRVIKISETVKIPPVYSWHIKMGPEYEYPTGILKISVDDPYSYHLHIHKRLLDLTSESELSMKPSPPSTKSMEERSNLIESESFAHSTTVDHYKSLEKNLDAEQHGTSETEQFNMTDVITWMVEDIVQLALDVFVFDSNYTYLTSHSKAIIPVYFTKAEHIGYHNSYYDLDFIDTETDSVVETKTVKIFAEVLPHPIQITPLILDMSNSPVTHGYCEDYFTIRNNHRLYAVSVDIKLTTKMKKIFCVAPMNTLLQPESDMKFEVKFCSRDYLSSKPSEDLVHFTFKIVLGGNTAVYQNVPPIFYELIAPCAFEFKKVYSEKYFKDNTQTE